MRYAQFRGGRFPLMALLRDPPDFRGALGRRVLHSGSRPKHCTCRGIAWSARAGALFFRKLRASTENKPAACVPKGFRSATAVWVILP